MDIKLYATTDNNVVEDTKLFEFSEDFFRKLAESEFSCLGVSKEISFTEDEEEIKVPAVALSEFVRKSLSEFLNNYTSELLYHCFENNCLKMHTEDLKGISSLSYFIKNGKYTYLYRIG
ncbi:hypothetical protein [Novacetimonas hansenii]|uniref:hypothetical protein n=1 Tax=Novacetimonas hansenii TaxID=436 RepID=UPI000A7A3B4E|nr:hypothetical protein [Novacetimonas hansenii]